MGLSGMGGGTEDRNAADEPARVRPRLTPAHVVGFTVLASIPVKALRTPLIDPDLWWHLRAGRLIAERRSIPRTDPFSFTAAGEPWVVQEWGPEVLLHWVRELFGLYGLLAYRALLLLALYVLVSRLIVKRMGSSLGAWALIGLTAYAGAPNWTERPNLLSFLLFVLTLTLLERRGTRSIWWFVPIAALWANLHGMVLVGVGLVALVAIAEGLKIAFRVENADAEWARTLGLVTASALAATMLNPFGPKLLSHSLSLVSNVRGIVTEWASPNFHQPGPLLFLALVLLCFSAFAFSPRPPDLTDLAMALAFTFLALQAVRNLAVAAIVLGLVCSRVLPDALRSLLRARPTPVRDEGGSAVPAVALAVVLIVFVGLVATGLPRGDETALISERYPLAAIDALDKPGARVFVYDFWSGMVIDRAWPNARVFSDLRTDFYGRQHIEGYRKTIAARPEWRQTLDEACVTDVLIQPKDALAQVLALDKGWKETRRDEVSVTFERATPCRS